MAGGAEGEVGMVLGGDGGCSSIGGRRASNELRITREGGRGVCSSCVSANFSVDIAVAGCPRSCCLERFGVEPARLMRRIPKIRLPLGSSSLCALACFDGVLGACSGSSSVAPRVYRTSSTLTEGAPCLELERLLPAVEGRFPTCWPYDARRGSGGFLLRVELEREPGTCIDIGLRGAPNTSCGSPVSAGTSCGRLVLAPTRWPAPTPAHSASSCSVAPGMSARSFSMLRSCTRAAGWAGGAPGPALPPPPRKNQPPAPDFDDDCAPAATSDTGRERCSIELRPLAGCSRGLSCNATSDGPVLARLRRPALHRLPTEPMRERSGDLVVGAEVDGRGSCAASSCSAVGAMAGLRSGVEGAVGSARSSSS